MPIVFSLVFTITSMHATPDAEIIAARSFLRSAISQESVVDDFGVRSWRLTEPNHFRAEMVPRGRPAYVLRVAGVPSKIQSQVRSAFKRDHERFRCFESG